MMKSYTLHIPIKAPTDHEALEKSHLVADCFQWGPVAFGVWWLFFKGYILAGFIALIAALIGIGILFFLIDVPFFLFPVIATLFHFFLGLEASTLIRWIYRQRNMPEALVVLANSDYEAEVKGFNQWIAERNKTNETRDSASVSLSLPTSPSPISPWSKSKEAPQEPNTPPLTTTNQDTSSPTEPYDREQTP